MRWDRKTPLQSNAVKMYNSHMGGVDQLNSLLGYYRMFFRSRKLYLRFVFIFLTSLNNAYLLYIRDFEASETPGKYLTLYEFTFSVSYALRNQTRPLLKVGRPAKVVQFERDGASMRKLP